MNNINYQSLIDDALTNKEAGFYISPDRKALVLAVSGNSDLVGALDHLWQEAQATLAPLDKTVTTLPNLKIDKYSVSPTYRMKRIIDGKHHYDFGYVPRS